MRAAVSHYSQLDFHDVNSFPLVEAVSKGKGEASGAPNRLGMKPMHSRRVALCGCQWWATVICPGLRTPLPYGRSCSNVSAHWNYTSSIYTSIYGPPLWASGQEFLATDPEARVRFPALPDFLEKKEKKTVVGLERAPLSLVSLDRKVAAPV
jgi:hypothetical protein